MQRKILWVGLSFLLVASLVLSSCGGAVEEEAVVEEEEEAVVEEEEATEEQEIVVETDKPQYGGTLTQIYNWSLTVFDPAVAGRMGIPEPGILRLTNDTGHIYDWALGPAGGYGTKQLTFQTNGFNGIEGIGVDHLYIPAWAGKWTALAADTFTLEIMPGVHYGLNPDSEASVLVGGRELTTDDVVANYVRYIYTPESYFYPHQTSVAMRSQFPDKTDPFVKKTGEWEITCTFPEHIYHSRNRFIIGWRNYIFPPEVWEEYGDVTDWENLVGTGPFMLTDFVPGSQATLIRNPNHWQLNPIGPGEGDQLPYVDTLRLLMILDESTRLAALRTAKSDFLSVVPLDNALELINSTPDLKYSSYVGGDSRQVNLRCDKEPFSDVRVRQALMMAIDYDGIIDSIYSGFGEKLVYPIMPEGGSASIQNNLRPSFDSLPAETQRLWSHDVEYAKELLTDAGYPDGFRTTMNIQNTSKDIDSATILQSMWADVGVDVDINIQERAVLLATWRNYEAMRMYWSSTAFVYGTWSPYVGENSSWVDDPKIFAEFEKVEALLAFDDPAIVKLWRDMQPYAQSQVYYIEFPQPHEFVFWWPWIKNYNGELNLDQRDNNVSWAKYAWIDQDLRESMTGKRNP
ncbi:ABC transporter substrate-binding protein [Chloroflexota bacterium]